MTQFQFTGTATELQRNQSFRQFNNDQYCTPTGSDTMYVFCVIKNNVDTNYSSGPWWFVGTVYFAHVFCLDFKRLFDMPIQCQAKVGRLHATG